MKKLISYFTKNIKSESYLIQTKAKALAFLDIFAIIFLFLYIALTFISGQYHDSVMRKLGVPFFLNFVLLADLLILYKGKFKLAGNLLPTLLLTVFLSFLLVFAHETYINYYVAGYYHVLIFMVSATLFSERKFVTLNFFIVIIYTSAIFFFFHTGKHNEFTHFVQTGFLNYLFAVIGIYVIIFFVNKFNEEALQIVEIALSKGLKLNELKKLIQTINNSTNQLKAESDELENNSDKISNTVNTQAANVEEISTSVEEITQTIVQGTENAQYIAEFTQTTFEQLKILQESFLDFINRAMQINEFTEKIKDIAEKTDILAINASIEAARAGEFSSGFKVIANEIRELSEGTKKIAESVIELVNKNKESSTTSKEYIEGLNKQMAKLSANTGNLAQSLEEEKITIGQVNNALTQLNDEAQTSTSVATQLSNSAQTLIKTAANLESIIYKYNKNNE